jgi:hypothetical protein
MFTLIPTDSLAAVLTKYSVPGDICAAITEELMPEGQCLWAGDDGNVPISSSMFTLGDEPIPANRFRGAADYVADHEPTDAEMVSFFTALGGDPVHAGYIKPTIWADALKVPEKVPAELAGD